MCRICLNFQICDRKNIYIWCGKDRKNGLKSSHSSFSPLSPTFPLNSFCEFSKKSTKNFQKKWFFFFNYDKNSCPKGIHFELSKQSFNQKLQISDLALDLIIRSGNSYFNWNSPDSNTTHIVSIPSSLKTSGPNWAVGEKFQKPSKRIAPEAKFFKNPPCLIQKKKLKIGFWGGP